MIALRVDHHALQHGFHLHGHFLEHLVQLTGSHEVSDVVVRVEAALRRFQALVAESLKLLV